MKENSNLHRISTPAFYILKYGMFLVISMFACTFLYYSVQAEHSAAEKFFHALPTARLMLEQSVAVLLIIIIAAFFFDAAMKNG